MSAPVDVALCQYDLSGRGDVEAVTDRATALLDRAGPADLFVLPELFAADAAAPGTGLPSLSADAFDRFVAWCGAQAAEREAVVVAGSAYVECERGVVNRCPVGTPDRVVTYDKRRPIPEEREAGVVPGEAPPVLVEHGDVTVGVLVCYDVEFPALARSAVDRGAELLAVPSWTASEAGYQRVSRCCAARAVENQAAVALVSLVGAHESDAVGSGTGRSAVYAPCDDVVGPHGTRLTLARDEAGAAACGLDFERLRTARESAAVRPYADTEVFDR